MFSNWDGTDESFTPLQKTAMKNGNSKFKAILAVMQWKQTDE